MRRSPRALAITIVLGTALLAYAAVGNGDIQPTQPTTVVTITSPTGSGSGTATLENTTAATTYNVLVGSDATCDPTLSFSVAGGNPIMNFAPMTSRSVQISCPPRGSAAMRRCLYHATNTVNGAALADFMGLCLYGETEPSLTPLQTSIDFGTITVGDFAQQTLTIRNDSTANETITRVFLQTSDLDGHFQLASPCNPDAAYCDEELASAVAPGGSFTVGIKCRPQTTGTHTAQLYVGTNTFQLQSVGVTLTCTGSESAAPALGVNPTTVEIPGPVEVNGGSASVTVRLENAGGGTVVITDVRTVDVDANAAEDWRYTASGECSGLISSMCSLTSRERVDIGVTFDPRSIGRRRAALLVSYRDTIDRTVEIPLDATGAGARLRRLGSTTLDFGMVPVGRMAQLDIDLANDGNRATTAMLSLPAGPTPYVLTPATMTTIEPGGKQSIMLTCAPTAAGTFATTVTVETTDVPPLQVTASATCEATAQELHASPTSLLLGEVRIGAPITRTVQVLSTDAGSPLTLVGQPQLVAANASITLGALSQMTTPATFDVTIAPQSTGSVSTAITLASEGGQTVRIPVEALAVDASFVVGTSSDLGTFCVDQPTTSSNVAFVSEGTAAIVLGAPTLQDSPSAFELAFSTPPVYPHYLPSLQAAVVAVTPKRRQVAGTVTDTVVWQTDVAGTATAMTDLTARFIDSGGAIAPPVLSFGEVTVHLYTDNGQRVVIQNCNPTPLVLDPPMIRTPFFIDSPTLPSLLDPNESVAFTVGFHPTRIGPVTETLRITSPQLPGAPLEVVLSGSGGAGSALPPDAGVGSNSFADTSFYACSCSSSRPLGGAPILLAIIAVSVRRRRAASSPR